MNDDENNSSADDGSSTEATTTGCTFWFLGVLIAGAGGALFLFWGWVAVIIGIAMIIVGCIRMDERLWIRCLLFIFAMAVACGVAFVGCSILLRNL